MKPVGFITPDGLEGSNTLPVYGRLNTPIYRVDNININICTSVGAAWARVALPRGPKCHITSTWPRVEINCFLH